LRGRELPAVPPANEVRILGTGPSTTFGAGEGGPDTDHTWAAALERGIAGQAGDAGDVVVLNGGVPGYSAIQAARRALVLIPELKPDLVLVFVSPGSQAMLDVSATRNFVRVGDDLVPADIAKDTPSFLLPAAAFGHRALSSSALYSRWRLQATDNGYRPKEIDRFVVSRAPHRPVIDPLLDRTWPDLAALAAGCREAGVELRAVLVPEPYMDSDERWREYLVENAGLGAPPVGTPRKEPIDVLAEKLAALGIQSWSMFDAMSLIGSDHDTFTCSDGGHWTAAGHEVIALAMLQNLRRENLLETLRERRAAHPRTP
jgi:lysophospholipase L1-like esterase